MKAAVYLRISQDKTGETLGVTRQREDCLTHAAQLGWDVAEVYVDNDISATTGKARPEYQRMLADCNQGTIAAIIAWHPDRLYRKVADLTGLIDVCKRNNVQISTCKAGAIDLTTPTGRLVAGLLAQVATYEGEAKSDRWKRSIRQRREAGTWTGTGRSRLFGYTRTGDIIDTEADIIRQLATAVIDRASIVSLARDLNTRGIPTALGNKWGPLGIRQILRNPRIAGYSTLSRAVPTGKQRKHRAGHTVDQVIRHVDIIGRGTWEPILDIETWEAVQFTLDTRSRPITAPRKAVLLGLAHCSVCDEPMVTGGRSKNGGTNLRTYRCQPTPKNPDPCGGVSIAAEPVEEIVESYARTRLADPAVRAALARLHAAPTGTAQEINSLEARVRELEAQLDEPGVPVATILAAIDRARTRLEQVLATVDTGPRTIPNPDTAWPTDVGRRAALINLVVAKVVITPATIRGKFDDGRVTIEER